MSAFFTVHHDLPREGPGCAGDVDWAVEQAGMASATRVLDAGSGPGADIAALLDAMPKAHVTAVDTHADFIETVTTRFPSDRVDGRQSDMVDVVGPYDFIWSAGAVYFLGVDAALRAFEPALAPGGAVAFSHPVFFSDTPSDAARAFWGGEGVDVGTGASIKAEIEAAGFSVVAMRPVPEMAWEEYYTPLEQRLEQLTPGADQELRDAIAETRVEIESWSRVKGETGYLLCVARPA